MPNISPRSEEVRWGSGSGKDGREVEDWVLQRQRLNQLVEASVNRTEFQRSNVAFVKTHKTASTTLTAVLYRYGMRHGKRVARFDVDGTAATLEFSALQVLCVPW
ncbi:unnamed protein product [Choristocarpus tenellus]